MRSVKKGRAVQQHLHVQVRRYSCCFITLLRLLLVCHLAKGNNSSMLLAQLLADDADADPSPALSQWIDEYASRHYQSSVYLAKNTVTDSNVGAGAYLFWKIDHEQESTIDIAIAVQQSQSSDDDLNDPVNHPDLVLGWLGFGLSENGGMRGADMMLYERSNPSTLTDAYVTDELVTPHVDTACQDWVLLNDNAAATYLLDEYDDNDSTTNGSTTSTTKTTTLIVQARRLLDTMDPQDRAIVDDSSLNVPMTRVIVAWGPEDNVLDGGGAYHGTNRVRGAVRFFAAAESESSASSASASTGNTDIASSISHASAASSNANNFQQRMKASADGSFFIGADNFRIPSQQVTTYQDFCFSSDDLEDLMGVDLEGTGGGVTIIGFEPVVDQVEHVHHFAVMASVDSNNNKDSCSWRDYPDFNYVWAPGEPPLALSDDVGLSLGGRDDDNNYKSLLIEIHYDNPFRFSGRRDSSGVRYYYTREKRTHELGMTSLGDPWLKLEGRSIGRGTTAHTFDCPSSCTTLALNDGPVTVLREYHHMHRYGISLLSHQVRDGNIVRTGKTEYFDFDQQGMQAVQQNPFEVQAGDSFLLQCSFRNPYSNVNFGYSSQEEMCMTYMMYYPRKRLASRRQRGSEINWMCGTNFNDMIGTDRCNAIYKDLGETDNSGMERTFGTPAVQCMERPRIVAIPED